jgi:hypothetical protein
MTRSSSAAAAVAATNAAFLKTSVKRSTFIILGITKESIKCAGCTNAEEKSLKSAQYLTRFLNNASILYVMARTRLDLGSNRFGLVEDL